MPVKKKTATKKSVKKAAKKVTKPVKKVAKKKKQFFRKALCESTGLFFLKLFAKMYLVKIKKIYEYNY